MPEEHSFDLRIAHSSPLFTATPLTGDRATGWATLCTASGYPCDAPGQSAVFTTIADATMDLQFWGSRIEVRGNLTGGMVLAWELDGASQTLSSEQASKEGSNVVGEPLGSGLLAVFDGLDSTKAHKLRITTKPSLPSAVVAFEGAVVTVGTGVAGGTMSMTYLDDSNPRLKYSQTPGGWAEYPEYDSPAFNITRPDGVTNLSFHSSKEPTESVGMNFNGTQVLLFGPCYSSNGAYAITLDQQDPILYNGSTNAYSAPHVASVAGACLRYISPPLSLDELHWVSMSNADKGRETNLDWVLIVGNNGGAPISNRKSRNVAAIAGAAAGSAALLIALVVLWCMLRYRRRRVKLVAVQTSSENSLNERKVKTVDLLSTNSDIPRLLDGERPSSLLSNPSQGGQSNTKSYQRIEPFALPPLVDDADDGKPGVRVESFPSSVSSTVPVPAVAPSTFASVASALTVPATHGETLEGNVVPACSQVPHPASQMPEPSAQPTTHPEKAQSQTPPAVLPQAEVQHASRARTHQSQPSQASSEATPDLSQISSDVNRILAQLGQIRRNGRRGYSGDVLSEEGEDIPGGAPPEYGKHRRV